MHRPDWNSTHFYKGTKIDLSFNVCIDRYVNFNFKYSSFSEVSKCYKILSNYHEISPYEIAIGFGISELMLRTLYWVKENNMSLTISKNSWLAVEGYKNSLDIKDGNDVLYIASTNGIDGTKITNKELSNLKQKYKYILLDEAYNDFGKETYTYDDNILRYKTMTKSLPLPGIRFGWMIGQKEIIKRIQDLRPSHVCVGGLEDNLQAMLNEIPLHVERMCYTKSYLEKNYECYESYGNYILLKDPNVLPEIHKKMNRMALCDMETLLEHS